MAAVRPEFRGDVLAPAADDPVLGWKVCQAAGCDRPAVSTNMCPAHHRRWRRFGRPDPATFLANPGPAPRGHGGVALIDFRGLPPRLRLELQYGVQRRCADQTVGAHFRVVTMAIRRVQQAEVSSLLDLSEHQWRQVARDGRGCPGDGGLRGSSEAFLVYARDAVESLRDGVGWEVEYRRDVWRLSKLPGLTLNSGRSSARGTLRFDRIIQPWLKDLGKRWVRLRLVSGLSVATAIADVQALTHFSGFLANVAPDVDALARIDRPLLERYLAWLATRPGGPATRGRWINGLHLFFQAIRQHNWDATLPTTAAFFVGDCPPRPPRLSRHLAEYVMAQVEQPANLERWPDPAARLVTLILIRCGLRVSDACTVRFDCLLHDGQRAPYLRYFNNKMKREAAVPIDAELEAEIRAQQQRVLQRWPGGNPHLFPRQKANASGQRSLAADTYRNMLDSWLHTCDVRDEHGHPVHLTAHQWRHTFATRLINRDVPREVIRVLLDHESLEMTAHYAKITDQTVRRRWEQATKVNVRGERVSIDPDGPLAQAQWAKTRYGIATQTLPHGYCGLPVQKSCPHANACLTCPVFLTGPEFLPELHAHRGRTLTLIDNAQAAGHTRVAEMNKQVFTNLDRMISELGPDDQTGAADAG
jgi:integrase